ncbi:DUF1054 domain-containing protein [Viridibacillus sp. FSL R5-0477]|uniref:UPF0637 protein C176_09807 n=1 Tax=Viridibacillus arenosi FSL R5-213 TaxID=1227360 RepID=W4F0W1_9BACL|nr:MULTISPECIES: DUF1054 domain-containing protein [Viridibacillus]ETT85716.1 hypothetical protein C176_09807 [Viridibacillus arenosi FSL R5-213]OMC83026.1 hypothetical protein BK130_09820 [Viridibacillus sp. FSL H8-0123]OMC88944.1 hypothetical protein BK128_03125 [Viridibacillus sp. FSL H7-0596]OMC93573.1 hypothetical protein BK137_03400 [Viridibacillus arenosi]
MPKTKWTQKDFDVFSIDGLEPRMEALINTVRPKFEELGTAFSTYFSAKTADEFYPHVAKHARRKVNPPKDSWVAFAPYKRGYKSIPHFQLGLFGTHLFIILCVIYEAPSKVEIADRLLKKQNSFKKLPKNFYVSGDHFSPEGINIKDALNDGQLVGLLERLRDVKKGEFIVGLQIPKEDAVQLTAEEFEKLTEETFDALLPIYNTMVNKK